MPAPSELLLEPLFDILSRVLQIRDLSLHHLTVYVLGQLERVLFHLHRHIAEFDVRQDLLYCGRQCPVFGDACLALLLIVQVFLFVLRVHCLGCHYYSNISFKLFVISQPNLP